MTKLDFLTPLRGEFARELLGRAGCNPWLGLLQCRDVRYELGRRITIGRMLYKNQRSCLSGGRLGKSSGPRGNDMDA